MLCSRSPGVLRKGFAEARQRVDVAEFGRALAYKEGEVCDGATAAGPVGVQPVAVFRFFSED